MLRQTVIYPLTNVLNAPARNQGRTWLRPEAREPIEGNQLPIGVPNAPPYPYDIDGMHNPGGPKDPRGPRWWQEFDLRYVWEPHLESVSGRVVDAAGVTSALRTDQVLASFVSYKAWQVNHPEPAGTAVLDTTTAMQPIAGVRDGIVGQREFYASNAGQGYTFPRQANLPDNACAQKVYRYWALVLSWDIDPANTGDMVVVWSWKLGEV